MRRFNVSSLKSKLNSIQRKSVSDLNRFKSESSSALRKLEQELRKLRNIRF